MLYARNLMTTESPLKKAPLLTPVVMLFMFAMILANLGPDKGRIHCYSFDGPYRENLDVSIGRRVARSLGLPHTTIRIDGSFFEKFESIAKDVVLSTDGHLDVSGAPNLFVNRIARTLSSVRLTGNYGSEVLRRYRAFLPSDSICRALQRPLAQSVNNVHVRWNVIQQGHPLDFIIF